MTVRILISFDPTDMEDVERYDNMASYYHAINIMVLIWISAWKL